MLESAVRVVVGVEPTEPELTRVAGLAALLAAVLAALGTSGQDGGLRAYLPILALIVLVTLGVFVWAVPSALTLDQPGPSNVAMLLSGLGVFALLLFWTGLPAVLGAGGIVLGRTQLEVAEERSVADAAIKVGVAAIVLYLLISTVDLL